MNTLIEIKCVQCEKVFSRRLTEHNRNMKKGREIYCSNKCCSLHAGYKKLIPYYGKNNQNLNSGRKLDKLSQFRQHLNNCRQHSNRTNKEFNITLQDLKEQWEKQNGICPYTGWELINGISTNAKNIKAPNRASLDRIDSSKGYTKDNIEFVSLMAQYAKNTFTKEQLVDFCRAVYINQLIENLM